MSGEQFPDAVPIIELLERIAQGVERIADAVSYDDRVEDRFPLDRIASALEDIELLKSKRAADKKT